MLMKIGIYGRVFLKPGSGIVRYSFELTESMIKYGKGNDYVIYFKKGEVPKLDFRGKYSIREVNLPYFLWRTALFTEILDKDGIDVFHSMAYTIPLVPRSLRKVAIVSTFHGLHSEYFWHSFKENIYSILNYRTASFFADRIIAVSETLKKEIHEKYKKPLDKIDVTYFGVNEDLKPLNKKQKKRTLPYLRKKYKIRSENYVIYVGGGMAKNKNFETILKTWSILKIKYHFSMPLIVTRVEMKSVSNLLKTLDLEEGKDIIGLKWIDSKDLKSLYSCATLDVYPSTYEGLGFPIIEAMRSGTPVITSNISAMPEAAGGAAILVKNPEDADEWARKIYILSKNKKLQTKLISKGIKHAKKFTWKVVVQETIKSYRASCINS